VTAIAGEHRMTSSQPASAIGASAGGTLTDDAVINVDPILNLIAVKAGADAASASPLEGSPFADKNCLKEALKEKKYAKFEYVAPVATPIPSPAPAASVPETGVSTNLALFTLLAAVGMTGMTLILRKKNEA